MSVFFKFNSELNYSYVDFDGLHISVSDLKKAILHQKRLGKSADFDLLISNAQTKEEYREDQFLIPKNTSLIVARIPVSNQHKKSWETAQSAVERAPQNQQSTENINHDISRMNGSEEDKIQAMMMQSTLDYDPTNYQRVRGTIQSGEVPPNYRCHKCHKPGHWIKNCPLNPPLGAKEHFHHKTRPESKKMTGIPRSLRDNIGSEPQEPQFVEEKREIPEDLICAICKGIFKDAVMIPCCGSSFCDECVRTALLESEDNECPDCKEKGTSPGSLIPNRFLRNAVATFHAESSNVLSRDSGKTKKEAEESAEAEVEETAEEEEETPALEEESQEKIGGEELEEKESGNEENEKFDPPVDKDSESDDDDDNITVTVPPAHQQSRGASFRDSRHRRIPSHGIESFSQSSNSSKNQQEEGESYEEENNPSRHRSNNSYDMPQGISSLGGDDKSSQGSSYHQHDYQSTQQNQQQPPPMFHPQGHQMPQGHYPSMYPHYQPQQQPHGPGYYPPNRPMRYEHQGNYPQHPMRHHPMIRPMHDNYGMRHRPPMNNLANAVSQNIQQRFGTGYIDDPLEAFNRIMREKEEKMRKDRYRRSSAERRSRSFERKRSPPAHQYSPDNRRGGNKNYLKSRKRSRSFNSNSRDRSYSRSRSRSRMRGGGGGVGGRSKSRSYSPRYRRKENALNKDRRDDRNTHHRSPARRGGNHYTGSSRNSRSTHRGESSYGSRPSRDVADNLQVPNETLERGHDKNDHNFESSSFEASHSLDEQPPPPGEENDAVNSYDVTSKSAVEDAPTAAVSEEGPPATTEHTVEVNGGSSDVKKTTDHHHHHHKKSRSSKHYETSSEEKKSRDKKKRKKSKEHEKKKSKKDRKEKRISSKAGTPETTVDRLDVPEDVEKEPDSVVQEPQSESEVILPPPEIPTASFKRSDSVLDINLDADEWIAPEVSKWEREENNKSLELGEVDVDAKKSEEKVTTEIIKRAENAIFAKAISAIRPVEIRKGKEGSPVGSVMKRNSESTLQVTVPNDGARSVEKKKSPMRMSIKNRLGVKVTENLSRSRSPVRNTENRRNKPLSSAVRRVSGERKLNDRRSPEERRKRTRTPEERKKRSRTPEVRRKRTRSPDERRKRTKTPEERKKRSRTPQDRRKRSRTPETRRKRTRTPEESTEVNGGGSNDVKKTDHHHKKNRSGKNYDSSEEKKLRDKKKRKKSKEREKKKSKKDRKEKKTSSKTGTPETDFEGKKRTTRTR